MTSSAERTVSRNRAEQATAPRRPGYGVERATVAPHQRPRAHLRHERAVAFARAHIVQAVVPDQHKAGDGDYPAARRRSVPMPQRLKQTDGLFKLGVVRRKTQTSVRTRPNPQDGVQWCRMKTRVSGTRAAANTMQHSTHHCFVHGRLRYAVLHP